MLLRGTPRGKEASLRARLFLVPRDGFTHKSLANPYPRTPAMAAGVSDHIWTCEEMAALLD